MLPTWPHFFCTLGVFCLALSLPYQDFRHYLLIHAQCRSVNLELDYSNISTKKRIYLPVLVYIKELKSNIVIEISMMCKVEIKSLIEKRAPAIRLYLLED